MALTLSVKKLSYVERLRSVGVGILENVSTAQTVKQGFIDSGFDTGANVITDAEVQVSYPDLVAQDIFAASAAIAAIDGLLAANGRQHYKALEKMRK